MVRELYRKARKLFIEFCLKPVKRSVDGLFAFWGLSQLIPFYPILRLLPVSNSCLFPEAEKCSLDARNQKSKSPIRGDLRRISLSQERMQLLIYNSQKAFVYDPEELWFAFLPQKAAR
jgi:hypothetical protein